MLVEASHRGWLGALPAAPHREPIAFERRRIIWYTKPADLPPVVPLEPPAAERPRAPKLTFPQGLRANAPKPESRRQMILQQAPQLRLPSDLPLPNVLAWNPEPPSAPRRRFQLTAPPVPRPQPQALEAAAAPDLKLRPTTATQLPVAPQPARPRFQVPDRAPVAPAPPRALEVSAPELALSPGAAPRLPVAPGQPPERPRFRLPERQARDTGAPLAIVGLDPAPALGPLPPGNRSAEFAAGPDARAHGNGNGDPPVEIAELRLPHLSIAPAAAPALAPPAPPSRASDHAALRRRLLSALPVTGAALRGAADPFLSGSTVYTLAIDMPNITSYDGSWTVRFTELGGSSPDDILTAPLPLRKVDPKYDPSAAAEGIQGKVLLYAVIGRDGRVGQVRLVQGIDERLNLNAVAAFSKWEFQPATKNGVPVDLEAVVQIPFRLRKP
jgi:TonB family protein